MTKKLDKLLEQREKINAKIQKARARETAQKRKEDTRRKILLGALMIEMMDKGELDDGVIMKRLERFLTRDIDRKLFDFPVQGDSDSTETTSDKKPTSCKKTTESKGAKKGSSESEDSEVLSEDLSVEIILEEYPSDKKIAVLKMVRGVTNLGLKDGKDLIESSPCVIHKTTQSEADAVKKDLEKLGAKVTLKVDS